MAEGREKKKSLKLPKHENYAIHDGAYSSDEDEEFQPLSSTRARKRQFPPGCQVKFCDYENPAEPHRITRTRKATVLQVGIDLTTTELRYKYKLRIEEDGAGASLSMTAKKNEEDLRYARNTPVWYKPRSPNINSQEHEAEIIGSEYCPASKESFYSVQVFASQRLYDEVPACKLRYRCVPMNAKTEEQFNIPVGTGTKASGRAVRTFCTDDDAQSPETPTKSDEMPLDKANQTSALDDSASIDTLESCSVGSFKHLLKLNTVEAVGDAADSSAGFDSDSEGSRRYEY